MKISNLEIAELALAACGIEIEDSLEWLSKNRPDEYKEIDGFEIGNMLVDMDNEIFDSNNPFLGLTEEEAEELEELEEDYD